MIYIYAIMREENHNTVYHQQYTLLQIIELKPSNTTYKHSPTN